MMRKPTACSVRSASRLTISSMQPMTRPTGIRRKKSATGLGASAATRIEHREQRNGGEQRPAKADALEQRAGKAQREQRADRRADEAEPERALADAHGVLDVGQAREDVPHAEGIDAECRKDPALRGQVQAESHLGARERIPQSFNRLSPMKQPCGGGPPADAGLDHDLEIVAQHVDAGPRVADDLDAAVFAAAMVAVGRAVVPQPVAPVGAEIGRGLVVDMRLADLPEQALADRCRSRSAGR